MEYKQLVGLRAYPTTNNRRSNMYIHIFFYLHNMLTTKTEAKNEFTKIFQESLVFKFIPH